MGIREDSRVHKNEVVGLANGCLFLLEPITSLSLKILTPGGIE